MTDLRKAAEMALEMFDWLERRSMYQDLQMEETHEALRQALAQQDKECVAIVNQGMGGIEWLSPPLPDDTPLYAAPPKREWVGLTDQEIENLWNQHESRFDYYSFSCDIEAKLKEKNT